MMNTVLQEKMSLFNIHNEAVHCFHQLRTRKEACTIAMSANRDGFEEKSAIFCALMCLILQIDGHVENPIRMPPSPDTHSKAAQISQHHPIHQPNIRNSPPIHSPTRTRSPKMAPRLLQPSEVTARLHPVSLRLAPP